MNNVRNPKTVTVLDAGSAKTVALICDVADTGLRYRGHAVVESRGSRKGNIVELDKAVQSIQKAVEEAEKIAECPVGNALVGAFTIGVIRNALNLHAVNAYYQLIVIGKVLPDPFHQCLPHTHPTDPDQPVILLAPDLFVLISVTIVWIEQAVLATVELHIFMRHDMNRTSKSTRLFTRKRPVQFVDQLPSL